MPVARCAAAALLLGVAACSSSGAGTAAPAGPSALSGFAQPGSRELARGAGSRTTHFPALHTGALVVGCLGSGRGEFTFLDDGRFQNRMTVDCGTDGARFPLSVGDRVDTVQVGVPASGRWIVLHVG